MDNYTDKVAVVTGAASGIGLALARDFARRGMKLVISDIEEAPLHEAEQSLRGSGTEVLAMVTNVAERAQVMALADAAWDRFGAVHVICNNAGVAHTALLQEATHEDWQWVMGVNLWGVIHGIEAFVPRMVAQGQGGHVVNTASMAGLIASPWLGVYNTTKYAVVGLSETLFKELRDHNIGVSVVCPMGVHTKIKQSSRNRPPELTLPNQKDNPMDLQGTYLTPEEVSAMTLRAMEAGELYVITHPESVPYVQRRFQRMADSMKIVHPQ